MKLSFALIVMAYCAMASIHSAEASSLRGQRNLEKHDEMMASKKTKIIATETLFDNSTVTFYEPEDGIISVVKDSPPQAKGMARSGISHEDDDSIPETPGELYKALTGSNDVPKSVAEAEMRMKQRSAKRLTYPPPLNDDDEQASETTSLPDDDDEEPAIDNNGSRKLANRCKRWEEKCITDGDGVTVKCGCWSCRTGNQGSRYTSKAVFAKLNPYRGSVSHMIRYWDGRRWRLSTGHDTKEGYTSRLWSYGDNTPNKVEVFNGKGDGWNWFVDYYDHEKHPGYHIAPPRCRNVY